MSMFRTVPDGIGLGKMSPVEGITQVLSPFGSAISAWQAPEVERARGKSAAEMANLVEQQAAKARADAAAAADEAFRLQDALAQLQGARDRLLRRYAPSGPLYARVEAAYAQEPKIAPNWAIQAVGAKQQADDIMSSLGTTALPTTATAALALMSRVDSMRSPMDVAVASLQEAAEGAEDAVKEIQAARVDAARRAQAAQVDLQRAQGSRLLAFFQSLGGGGLGR